MGSARCYGRGCRCNQELVQRITWPLSASRSYAPYRDFLQHDPPYMKVMLHVTDFVDRLPPSPTPYYFFTLYKQTVAAAVPMRFHWHVSCHVPSWRNMSSTVVSPGVQAFIPKEDTME